MRLITHLLEFPLLSYYTYSPYWCTCQGQETQSKHISKTYTLMLKLIIHLSLMHTDVWLQHHSLIPQTVGGRECSTLTTTQCTASIDCWRKGAHPASLTQTVKDPVKILHILTLCCEKACVAYLPCCHGWHSIIDRTTSCRQYLIGSWLLSLILSLFKVSPALMSPFRSYCYWILDAIQQLLAWWEDGIRGRQLHNLERVLLGWLPQMKLIIVFCYSK